MASATPQPAAAKLFTDDAREHLKIFIAPLGIDNGERQVMAQAITNENGTVVDEPADAHLVLANPIDISALMAPLMASWRLTSAERIILHYSWFYRSISARKPLLENDNFGGCLISRIDGSGEEHKNHNVYPSPRTTPDGLSTATMSRLGPFPFDDRSSPTPGTSLASASTSSSQGGQMPNFAIGSSHPQLPFYGQQMFWPWGMPPMPHQHMFPNVPHMIPHAAGMLPFPHQMGPPSGSIFPMLEPSNNPLLHQHQDEQEVQASRSPFPAPQSLRTNKLFKRNSKSLKFYVDSNYGHSRTALVKKITRHGGDITSAENSDYAILNVNSKDYRALYQGAHDAGSRLIKASYIDDCVDQLSLLDHTSYLDDKTPPPLSAARRRSSQTVKQEKEQKPPTLKIEKDREDKSVTSYSPGKTIERKPALKIEDSQPASSSGKRKMLDPPEPREKKAKKTESARPMSRNALAVPRMPSPSPPPEHTRQEMGHGSGKFKYTLEERQWANDYCKVMLQRDPDVSITDMAAALFSKAPHHTSRSWTAALSNMVDLITLRKRAGVAYRKALASSGTSLQTSSIQDVCAPANSANNSKAISKNQTSEAATKENVIVCAKYFAFGLGAEDCQDDEQDEDVSWSKMEELYALPSGYDSWKLFYDAHHSDVEKEYNRLLTA